MPPRGKSPSGSSHSSRSYGASSSGYRNSGVDTGSSSREYRYPTPSHSRINSANMISRLILHDTIHNYTYVPYDYTDSNGSRKQSGYYDENGTYYEKGSFENQAMELTCPYCDSKSKIVWTEGALPRCPVCGGQYDLNPQTPITTSYSTSYTSRTKKNKARPFLLIAITIAVLCIVNLFVMRLSRKESNPKSSNATYKTTQQTKTSSDRDIYVEEIGRTCTWDYDYEWWVDKKSGCYFYFDETIAPSQWKYWYDGIGDDYGDYGWMEYDDDEGVWYIESSENNWEVLPDKYDLKGVWHMKDAFQEPVLNN